jgi:UPF0755 protein
VSKTVGGIILGLVAIGIGIFISFRMVEAWSTAPIELATPVIVEFPRGTKLAKLSQTLSERGVISSQSYFTIWVRGIKRSYGGFQAGTYKFEGPTSPMDIHRKLTSGDIYVPISAIVTIPEGFSMRKTFERLAANGIGTIQELQKLDNNQKFLQALRVPAPSLEGYLYPATYRFTQKLPTAEEAIKTMVQTFWEKLPEGYEKAVNDLGLTLHKAVIFASMIELETMFDDERDKISEVIWRRLKSNEPLGIDAALIYGIADYQGDIKWVHLRDAKNPYNLRIHKGLPPSPIASPSVDSLQAVLTPSKFGYNYYVLEANESGRHFFSKTLAEHNRAVERYVKWYRARQKNLRTDTGSIGSP